MTGSSAKLLQIQGKWYFRVPGLNKTRPGVKQKQGGKSKNHDGGLKNHGGGIKKNKVGGQKTMVAQEMIRIFSTKLLTNL